jgi:hypothetical protein
MRMRVRQVAAGEKEADAGNAVERLHGCGELLPQPQDRRDHALRQVVEIIEVLPRDDERVPRPDRA